MFRRYNLSGDIESAITLDYDPNGPEAKARFYDVSLEDYLRGQEWAHESLPRLRCEAGLEQDHAAEAAETQQAEEPQAVASNRSAPHPPVVPARSLLSFAVRRLAGLFWPFIL